MLTPKNRNAILVSILVALILFGWYKTSSSSSIAFAAAIVAASGGKQGRSAPGLPIPAGAAPSHPGWAVCPRRQTR